MQPSLTIMTDTFHPSSVQTSPTPRLFGALVGDPTTTLFTVFATFVSAEVVSRGCIPTSPWRYGNGAHGRFARAGASRSPCTPASLSPACGRCLLVPCAPAPLGVLSGSCSCPWLAHSPCVSARSRFFLCLGPSLCTRPRSDQLRQLAVQLASLASLEDVVTPRHPLFPGSVPGAH